jgi:ubiquinone/menaquinone biosynthesis C-methylase UbiE
MLEPVGAISRYWGREGLDRAILDGLAAAGRDLEALTVDDLAPADQFHGGGKGATVRLARLAALGPDRRVVDVGGGLGGPARTLAAEFGCRVTAVDLTEPYVRAARALTARLGLAARVAHVVGDALALPLASGAADVVWTQNSGMNIADKPGLYREFHRVLAPGGLLALQEPMAGPVEPVIYPVMWAPDARSSFLRPPGEMRALVEAAGFQALAWDDVTAETAPPATRAPESALSIQRLVMGDALDAITEVGRRNREEGRVVSIQAVFRRR